MIFASITLLEIEIFKKQPNSLNIPKARLHKSFKKKFLGRIFKTNYVALCCNWNMKHIVKEYQYSENIFSF